MRTVDHTGGGSPSVPAAVADAALRELQEGLLRAGQELFAAYGIEFTPGREAAPRPAAEQHNTAFLGIVGFGGPTFAGHVVISVDEGLLRRSNTTLSSSDDWMAELSNQFLGRMKNHLLRQGISIHRLPPVVIKGRAVTLASFHHGSDPVTLADGRDRVVIWIGSEPSTDPTAATPNDAAADVLNEGDMVLF